MPWYDGRWHLYSEAEHRAYGEQQREIRRKKWHAKYITKTGLKKERHWTDAMIKKFLRPVKDCGVPEVVAFLRTSVLKAEKKPEFQTWMAKRTQDRVIPFPQRQAPPPAPGLP
jgi:hypothetical protein